VYRGFHGPRRTTSPARQVASWPVIAVIQPFLPRAPGGKAGAVDLLSVGKRRREAPAACLVSVGRVVGRVRKQTTSTSGPSCREPSGPRGCQPGCSGSWSGRHGPHLCMCVRNFGSVLHSKSKTPPFPMRRMSMCLTLLHACQIEAEVLLPSCRCTSASVFAGCTW